MSSIEGCSCHHYISSPSATASTSRTYLTDPIILTAHSHSTQQHTSSPHRSHNSHCTFSLHIFSPRTMTTQLPMGLRICDPCQQEGVVRLSTTPGVFEVTCRYGTCHRTWYACGVCPRSRTKYFVDSNALLTKLANHMRDKHDTVFTPPQKSDRTINDRHAECTLTDAFNAHS